MTQRARLQEGKSQQSGIQPLQRQEGAGSSQDIGTPQVEQQLKDLMREFATTKSSEETQEAVDKQVREDVLHSSRQGNINIMPVYVKRETVDGKKVMQDTVTSQIADT